MASAEPGSGAPAVRQSATSPQNVHLRPDAFMGHSTAEMHSAVAG